MKEIGWDERSAETIFLIKKMNWNLWRKDKICFSIIGTISTGSGWSPIYDMVHQSKTDHEKSIV